MMINNPDLRIKKYGRLSFYAAIFFLILFLCSFCTAESTEQRDFDKEEKIGRRMAERIEKQYELVDDPESLVRINRIGEQLKNLSDYPAIHYQFAILDREGPNAFALPGGFIYLTADLLEYVQSDDELAAVIAHEMGHVIHQHSIKQMKDNRKFQLVELVTVLLTGDPNLGLLSELTGITLLNSYRREYEEEADLTALQLLNQSDCYHPVALLTYFERVNSEDLLKPGQDAGIFQTHPDTQARIRKVKQYLRENGIEINRRLTTSYLTVDGEVKEEHQQMIARVTINQEEILAFSGTEEDALQQKLTEIMSRLDQSLRIDLEPYEIVLYEGEEESSLRIGSEQIVTLASSEVDFLNLTAVEMLGQAKEKMARILWQLKLTLPVLFLKE